MIRDWLIRSARSVLVLVIVAAVTCQLSRLLPGDPALILLGQESSESQRAALRHTLGLDQNFFVHFYAWVGGIVRGDWGTSFSSGRPVLSEIWQRFPATAELVLLSQLLALAIIIPLALHSAYQMGRNFDRVISGGTFLVLAMPSFVVGILLMYLFAVQLHWFPASGFVPFISDPVDNLRHLVLPVFTLGIAEAAIYLRTLRGAAIETLRAPYIYASSARGASEFQLLWRRVLRPSSAPLVSLVGLTTAIALGGTLLVESLFAIPGLGRLTVTALGERDLPMIQGTVFFGAIIIVLISVLIDGLVKWIDPRGARVVS